MTKPDIRESPWTQYDLSNSQFFPLKLMTVLSMIEFNDISQWTDSGKAFRIMDPARFESEVMVDHFKRAKFASFLRKLRRWGFLRIYRGPDSGMYDQCSIRTPGLQRLSDAFSIPQLFLTQEPTTTRIFNGVTLRRLSKCHA